MIARFRQYLENGKTGIVDFLGKNESGFGSTEFIVLRGKKELKSPYVACLSRDENFRKHCIQNMVGSSGRQRVQNSCFNSYFLALPKTTQILELFNQSTSPNFKKVSHTKNEINTLTQLRDTILPKLISGELRISDAGEFLGEISV